MGGGHGKEKKEVVVLYFPQFSPRVLAKAGWISTANGFSPPSSR